MKFKYTAFIIAFFGANLSANAATNNQNNSQQIQADIFNVSQKISQLTVSSNVVETFNNELKTIQLLETQAENLFQSDSSKAQNLFITVQQKIKKLDQLVDLTNGSEDDMSGDNAEELQGLKASIDSAQMEINKISINGADVTSLKNGLQEAKTIVSSAQDSINKKDTQTANILIKKAQDRIDALNDQIDGVLDIDYDGGRKLVRDYSNAISDAVDNLKSLAQIDDEIDVQIQNVAQQQEKSITNVKEIVSKISTRRGFAKFLIGANFNAINKLNLQAEQNLQNIEKLKLASFQISDPAVTAVLQTQIQTMSQQTASIQAYVQKNDGGYSLFGWFLKYL